MSRRLVYGPSFIGIGDYAFRNWMKGANNFQGLSFTPGTFNANMYPTSTPVTSAGYYGWYILVPASYSGNWIVKWSGAMAQLWLNTNGSGGPSTPTTISKSGTVTDHGLGAFSNTGTSARIVITLPAGTTSLEVRFSTDGPYTNFDDLQIYQEAEENLSGYWRQDYLDHLNAVKPIAFRNMNWMSMVACNITKWSLRTPVNNISWGAFYWPPSIQAGDLGGTDTYTCGSYPDMPGVWTDKESFIAKVVNTNTSTTPTINVGGRGAKAIVAPDVGEALAAGQMNADRQYVFLYDGVVDKVVLASNALDTGVSAMVPFEVQVNLCNLTSMSLWGCIPWYYDDASVTAMVTYAAVNLTGRLWLELSNEIWNIAGGFYSTGAAINDGIAWGAPAGNGLRQSSTGYAKRYCEVMALAMTAWTNAGRSASDLKRILACQAHGGASLGGTQDLYRLLGTDLAAYGFNAAPNRPIDRCDYLSFASYTSGSELVNFQGVYGSDASKISGLMTAADQYATGTPSLMQQALNWLDADIRVGTAGGIDASQTAGGLNSAIYPAWQALAANYGKKLVEYEASMEASAPDASRCTTLGISTTYATKISNLLLAWKNSHYFMTYTTTRLKQFLAQADALYPAQYTAIDNGAQWATHPGDLYSTPYKSWDALVRFGEDSPSGWRPRA